MVMQELIEAEPTEVIGAGRYERSDRGRAQRIPTPDLVYKGR
jgi:hypothetical protein